ncbi:hypothetical protein LTR37_014091 [Vermiconidia calcicola]|uniref:Uncharacterized protein n=1 Tax=Vermiconidia calcicola TaxID=1690605 RepID=A0ACC3MUH9_9PEZI|nr:hypothetical protein LTR37_014091 [Vermiconidia calcicola]
MPSDSTTQSDSSQSSVARREATHPQPTTHPILPQPAHGGKTHEPTKEFKTPQLTDGRQTTTTPGSIPPRPIKNPSRGLVQKHSNAQAIGDSDTRDLSPPPRRDLTSIFGIKKANAQEQAIDKDDDITDSDDGDLDAPPRPPPRRGLGSILPSRKATASDRSALPHHNISSDGGDADTEGNDEEDDTQEDGRKRKRASIPTHTKVQASKKRVKGSDNRTTEKETVKEVNGLRGWITRTHKRAVQMRKDNCLKASMVSVEALVWPKASTPFPERMALFVKNLEKCAHQVGMVSEEEHITSEPSGLKGYKLSLKTDGTKETIRLACAALKKCGETLDGVQKSVEERKKRAEGGER